MKFGQVGVDVAAGTILGHTLRLPGGGALKKGRVLSPDDVSALRRGGVESVFAARLEAGDIGEDEAAATLASVLAGAGVRVAEAATGRCNLYASEAGVARIDAACIDAVNRVDEALTVATVTPNATLAAGAMIATVKIIPLAVSGAEVARCTAIIDEQDSAAYPAAVSLMPFRRLRAGLILSQLAGVHATQLDRAATNLRARLAAIGGEVSDERRCSHDPEALAAAVRAQHAAGCAPILILGASAIVDRHDVVPLAVTLAGGRVERLGMPVDPGNLLLLGQLDQTPIVGVPGCARSLAPNGLDWVLARLSAGLPVDTGTLAAMGVGGLLAENPQRPALRQGSSRPEAARPPRVHAVVLAAGCSARMGADNKLLAEIDGRPMVARVVAALAAAPVARVVVVTGHQRAEVEAALADLAEGGGTAGQMISFAHNRDYAAGMSTSLRVGVQAARSRPERDDRADDADDAAEADAVLVCLGDMPWIEPAHIAALIEAFAPTHGRAICVPVYDGKRGNPVLFASHFCDQMDQLRGDVGARAIIDAHADVVCEVAMSDSAVLVDIDTQAALRALGVRPAPPTHDAAKPELPGEPAPARTD